MLKQDVVDSNPGQGTSGSGNTSQLPCHLPFSRFHAPDQKSLATPSGSASGLVISFRGTRCQATIYAITKSMNIPVSLSLES